MTGSRQGDMRPELRAQRPCEPGDEQQGEWPREQLLKMNQDFCERVSRALARDKRTASDLIKRAK
jgi:hypothetical protein